MYPRLRSYLYIVFLMIISSSSFALTAEEQAFNGFAFNTVCAHPSDLNFCFKADEGNAQISACMSWMSWMQSGQTSGNFRQYTFKEVKNGSCIYDYVLVESGTRGTSSQALTNRVGMCPKRDQPPPRLIVFSRQGRWFSQELGSSRCFDKCEYSITSTTFSHKHYAFTNGIVTEFTETNDRAKSKENFCIAQVEPTRNSDGEVVNDASCNDAVFKVMCDFVNWYRTDSELQAAPEVENKTLDIPGFLDGSRIKVNPNSTADFQCFAPLDWKFDIPHYGRLEGQFSYQPLCNGLHIFGTLLRALYLLHAALIIFRK